MNILLIFIIVCTVYILRITKNCSRMILRSTQSQQQNNRNPSMIQQSNYASNDINSLPPSMRPRKNIRKMMKQHDESIRQQASSPSLYFPFSHQSQQFAASSSQLPPPLSSNNILPSLMETQKYPPSHIVKQSQQESIDLTPHKTTASAIDPRIRARTRSKIYSRLGKRSTSNITPSQSPTDNQRRKTPLNKVNINYTNHNNSNSITRQRSPTPSINTMSLLKPAFYNGMTRAMQSQHSNNNNNKNLKKIQSQSPNYLAYSKTTPLKPYLINPPQTSTNYHMPNNNSMNNMSSTIYHSIINNNSLISNEEGKMKTMSPLQQDNLYRATMGLADMSEPVYEKKKTHKGVFSYAKSKPNQSYQENMFLLNQTNPQQQQNNYYKQNQQDVFRPNSNNSNNKVQTYRNQQNSFSQQFPSQILTFIDQEPTHNNINNEQQHAQQNPVSPLRTPVFTTTRQSQLTYYPSAAPHDYSIKHLQEQLIKHSQQLADLREKIQKLYEKQDEQKCNLLRKLVQKQQQLCGRQEEINKNLEQIVTLQAISNINNQRQYRKETRNSHEGINYQQKQKEEELYIKKQLERRRRHRLEQISKENQKIYEELQRRRNKYQHKISPSFHNNNHNQSHTLAFNHNNIEISALYPNQTYNSNEDDTLGEFLSPFAVNPSDI